MEDVLDLAFATERYDLLVNHEPAHANTALDFFLKVECFRIAIILDKVGLNFCHLCVSPEDGRQLTDFVQLRVLRRRDVAIALRLRKPNEKFLD